MKNVVYLIVGLFLVSCSNNTVPKPENDLTEEKMLEIYYDLVLLQAADNSFPNKLNEEGISPSKYILKKYIIDSITFVQNQRYYASDANRYKKMYEKILDKIEAEKAIVDTLMKKEFKDNSIRKKLIVRDN